MPCFRRLLIVRLVSSSIAIAVRSNHHQSSAFAATVTSWLGQQSISWQPSTVFLNEQQHVLEVETTKRFLLHIIPSPVQHDEQAMPPSFCKDMTDKALLLLLSSDVVHLHQDIWNSKTDIVQSRLRVKAGIETRRIFARKTTVKRITGDVARAFLLEHHLWGATKAKYVYGLFASAATNKSDANDLELVAAASFSSGRTVVRDGIPCQSHELLRFCTKRDTTVVGGLSKLIKAFVREQQPDDIVTQIDRDWGGGSGWCKLGFTSVAIMPPLVMAIGAEDGLRRHLVGAGIRHETEQRDDGNNADQSSARMGLPFHVYDGLSKLGDVAFDEANDYLQSNGFHPVYDSGVERLCMLVPTSQAARALQQKYSMMSIDDALTRKTWETSVPMYPSTYYSPNAGIAKLLVHANGGS